MKEFQRNTGRIDMDTKEQGFESMVHAYSKDLYRFGYWLSRDSAIAEDLVQETFLRAWRAIDTLQDAKAAKSWLFTILRRENARRFEKKSAQAELTTLDDELVDILASVDDDFANIDILAIREAFRKLPASYAEPLILQVIGGYSCDEIAEIIEVKPGAVMTRVFRARQKLRKLLDEDEGHKASV
jgi:RNA polymerase sigma-70 factor (ECF subfamily)